MGKAEEYAELRREVARLFDRMDESPHLHRLYIDASDKLCRWEQQNGDLIERALRVAQLIERPGDLLLTLDQKVREEIARWEQPLQPRHYVDFVLAAIREAVR